MSTGYLKVHIAEEVFQTLDIGQNDVIVIGVTSYQTTGNTCYRSFDRYTCCHQGHTGCTDTCLRSRTVGFKSLRYGTDGIWELFLTRQYRNQRTLCQSSMTDLTTSRSSGSVWSRLQSSSGSYNDAYISWLLSCLIQAIQTSVPQTAEPGCRRCRSESVHG